MLIYKELETHIGTDTILAMLDRIVPSIGGVRHCGPSKRQGFGYHERATSP